MTEYVEAVGRYGTEIGRLDWAAPMDWMCEPKMLESTGMTVREHQDRTVENYLELRDQGPFIPVLQGWTEPDYHACVDLYATAGVDLAAMPLVGLGTVCRRQGTPEIRRVVSGLAERGLSLHGFGVKKLGLPAIAHLVTSADSMAWSSRGRMAWQHDDQQLCGGAGDHRGSCANCQAWALQWRSGLIDSLGLFGRESE